MKGRLLALIVGMLLIGVVPATASASSFGEQTGAQEAGSTQTATSGAKSTQIAPSNDNISVRVLSAGDNGDVSQSNNSSAKSGALNANSTGQGTSQVQSGGGAASKALQTAAQWAGNEQSADSKADSTQVHPSNENISVRVMSPGDDGNVDQSNNSDAKSFAGNKNDTLQKTDQSQGGSGSGSVISPARVVKGDPCGCDSGSKAIQAAGQDALNTQDAHSEATSKQVKPENQNDPVRILSEGDNGSVDQSNNSEAKSFAGNLNLTGQDVKQTQAGTSGSCCSDLVTQRDPCGCLGGSTGIQAAGQDAFNKQDAMSFGTSEQLGASNDNLPLRLKHSDGSNGDVSQENNSSAESKSLNLNRLLQMLQQLQGLSGGGGVIRGQV